MPIENNENAQEQQVIGNGAYEQRNDSICMMK